MRRQKQWRCAPAIVVALVGAGAEPADLRARIDGVRSGRGSVLVTFCLPRRSAPGADLSASASDTCPTGDPTAASSRGP